MSSNRGKRLKEPHAPSDISKIEDELAQISEDLRTIRRKMADKELAAVELMSGTFRFYITELQQIAKGWMAELEKQLIVKQADEVRQRKIRQRKESK